MALQWLILTYVVAAEAAVAILLTLPTPKLLRDRFASLVSLILQPALFIVPFAGFQLLGALLLFLKRVSLISSSNNWVGLKIISFILLDWWVGCCQLLQLLFVLGFTDDHPYGCLLVVKILNLSHFLFGMDCADI